MGPPPRKPTGGFDDTDVVTVSEPDDRVEAPASIVPGRRVQSLTDSPIPLRISDAPTDPSGTHDTVVSVAGPKFDPIHASTEDDPEGGVLFAAFGDEGGNAVASSAAVSVQSHLKPQLTEVLQRAGSVAAAFAGTFLARTVRGDVRRGPRIQALEMDTPEAGRLARQSVLLIPVERGFRALVCGFLDAEHHYVRLRGHVTLDRMHRARTGQPVPLDAGDYGELVLEMAQFLRGRGLKVDVETAMPGAVTTSDSLAGLRVAVQPSFSPRVLISLAVAILVLLLVVTGALALRARVSPKTAVSPAGTPPAPAAPSAPPR